MGRHAFTLLEVIVAVALVAVLALPLLQLSSRNVEDHQDVLERSIGQGLCLDMVERFKKYKPMWPLPGAPARSPARAAGPSLSQLFCPVELDPARTTLFDTVYLDLLGSLGMSPRPRIVTKPDPGRPGFFRLEVSVSWRSRGGHERVVRFSRFCYAP
jgi:prepilin-type N-terminal cleavage/methylation domain-containing protein